MAEALTHVLIGYTFATLLSVRYRWITPPLATVAMAGAMLPDLNRLEWIVPAETVESVVGASFSWRPMHSIGGVLVVICIASLAVRPRYRRAVATLLALGALSHVVLDLLLVPPWGTYPYLWPITSAEIVFPGFYNSRDRWTVPVALLLAFGARSIAHRRHRSLETESPVRADG